ncbi:hypothetical protein [Streptomyces sp. 11x1]|uniref:hypothetical protein n=1 Tax=Streptomyces sp. 11x1 TaxID=3038642 RepID=UPI002931D5A9|nr:hypothetical protein [Streptomyces sp. 11x1]WNZ11500.1 hypothetical protein P8T65_30740 [Streptomyces sp. 11x1]
MRHHLPWESDVQKWFRNGDALADANTDSSHDGRLLLGMDRERLAACASHARLRNPGIETPLRKEIGFDGPIRNLKAVAVACADRGQGGTIADQVMEDVLYDIQNREAGESTLVVSRINKSNKASERFAVRNGFGLLEDIPDPDDERSWFLLLNQVPAADVEKPLVAA